MKKIFMFLTLSVALIGCTNENMKTEKIQGNANKKVEKVYSTVELEKLMNKIVNSKEKFLSGIVYFQKGIKPQDLSFTEQKEIIWLQVDEKSIKFDNVKLENMISEKIGVPINVLRIDIVKVPTEYSPTMEPY